MDNFAIKAYGVQELGQSYLPHISPSSASQQLTKWINLNSFLREDLAKTGYKPGQKLLTPRQVELIVKHLGPP